MTGTDDRTGVSGADDVRSRAYRLIVTLGIVSLLADFTYESARSLAGPWLGLLGASALVVTSVSGVGEFLSYGLRLVSGTAADRSGRHWAWTLAGYSVNLLAVPALALAGGWTGAAALLLLERAGKGLRTPPRDALLSYAANRVGPGRGFGLHEALDQVGAVLGPLVVAGVLTVADSYRLAFVSLLVPAALALAALARARSRFPEPERLEAEDAANRKRIEVRRNPEAGEEDQLAGARIDRSAWRDLLKDRSFRWILLGATAFGAGFVDFPLIAYHDARASLLSAAAIPLAYAGAMGVDALAALGLGHLFDRRPAAALAAGPLAGAAAAPLLFLVHGPGLLVGIGLWGVSLGCLESVLRAAVAARLPSGLRATGFGVFSATFGLAWMAGSVVIGVLYERSLMLAAAWSVGLLLAATLLLARAASEEDG